MSTGNVSGPLYITTWSTPVSRQDVLFDHHALPAAANTTSSTAVAAPVVAAISLAVVFLLAAVGNILVLYVIIRHLYCGSVSNAFIASLAVSDLAVTVTCIPFSFVTVVIGRWVFGGTFCLINGTLYTWYTSCSTLTLTFIAVDRAFIISNSPKSPLSLPHARRLMVVTWLVTVLLSLPWRNIALGSSTGAFKLGFYHCMYVFHIRSSHQPSAYSALYVIGVYGVSFLTMIYCCIGIWKGRRAQDLRVRPASTAPNHLLFHGEIRTASTVLIMIGFCFVCRGVYVISSLVLAGLGQEYSPSLDTLAMWLTLTNSCLNPIIYAVRNPNVAQFMTFGRLGRYKDPTLTDHIHGITSPPKLTVVTIPEEEEEKSSAKRDRTKEVSENAVDISVWDSEVGQRRLFGHRKSSAISTLTTATDTTTV